MALTKAVLGGKLLFPSAFVAAVELKGDRTATIKGVFIEELKMANGAKDRKPVLTFIESAKKLILNKTNASTIADMYGPEAEKWIGQKVTLYPSKTTCGRDTVDCIRIRNTKPAKPADAAPFPEGDPQGEPESDAFAGDGQQSDAGSAKVIPPHGRTSAAWIDDLIQMHKPEGTTAIHSRQNFHGKDVEPWEKLTPERQDEKHAALIGGTFVW